MTTKRAGSGGAAPSRAAQSTASNVVDWLTLGVLGAATVALAITSSRAVRKAAKDAKRASGSLSDQKA